MYMILTSFLWPLIWNQQSQRNHKRKVTPVTLLHGVFWLQRCSGKETHTLSPTKGFFLTEGPMGKILSWDCFSCLPYLVDNGWSFGDVVSLFLELLTDPVTTLLWLSASFCVDVTSNFFQQWEEGKRWEGSLRILSFSLGSKVSSFLMQLVSKQGRFRPRLLYGCKPGWILSCFPIIHSSATQF